MSRRSSGRLPRWVPAACSNVNDWIDEYLIFGDPNCVPPRERQRKWISIDGGAGADLG